MRPPYRGDVDGLRAIAVLLVVAFHAWPRKVPGGFVGVDVFFVISGFLITSLILRGFQAGDFSFIDFYARRIKRIFPALIVVLAACLAFGWIVMFPGEYRDLGKHSGAGAAFAANFSFLFEAGYFDASADQKPLLHLWSLGIEEQFYFAWPLLLVLALRWKNGPLTMAILICLGSFAWNVALVSSEPSQAFYLPFTRFWELMVGCIIAFGVTRSSFAGFSPARLTAFYDANRERIHDWAGWLGLALIALAAAVLNPQRAFPGWWALLPTIGAALIILAGPQSTMNRVLLSHRVMITIGLISYPLYLWHWPILSYARMIHYKDPSDLLKILLIALAFGLAHLTYKYVERPIRFGAPTPRKPLMAVAAMAVVGVVGVLVYAGGGIPSRFPKELQNVVGDSHRSPNEDYRQYRCLYDNKGAVDFASACDGSDQPGTRRIVLWGDSHAAHLGPGLDELRRRDNFKLAQYSGAACPPVMSFTIGAQKNCPRLNQIAPQRIAEFKPDTVILSARWEVYNGGHFGRVQPDEIKATIAHLKSLGVRRVVVMGQFPVWRAQVPQLRARNYRLAAIGLASDASAQTDRSNEFLIPAVLPADEMIRQAVAGTAAEFVSPLSTLCNKEGCLLVIPGTGGKPIYWDSNHFTRSGSIYFIEHNKAAIAGP